MQHCLDMFCNRQSKTIGLIEIVKIIRCFPYVFGFLIVPLLRLILVMTSKSLKRKNPRSLRGA